MSRTDVLMDADWVEAHLDDPKVVLVEVDEDFVAYNTGHIAGAVRLDWATELQQAGVRDVIGRDAFGGLLSAKGIGNDDIVVLYGGNNNWFAAYAYWYLKLYGHRDVRLLNGGRKKWELDDRPLTTEVPQRPRTDYLASEQDLSIRAFADEVRDAIGGRNLVDVRSPDEFAGKIAAPAHLPQEAGARLGHIPTAVNLPWSKTANDDGTFKSDDELRALYADAGLDPQKEVIAYCRIGERSSHSWFVLRELLGHTTAKELRRQLPAVGGAQRDARAQPADRGLTRPSTRTRRRDMRNPFKPRIHRSALIGSGLPNEQMPSYLGR